MSKKYLCTYDCDISTLHIGTNHPLHGWWKKKKKGTDELILRNMV